MNSEQIDKIFEAMKNENYEYLWNVSEMPYEFSAEKVYDYYEEIKKRLGKLIQQGDFEYFLTKMNGDLNDKRIFSKLLSSTSKVEEMKKCIDEKKSIGLDSYEVTELIIGVNDSKYIKDCIDNRREELSLKSSNLISLIEKVEDSEYIKDCIDNRREELGIKYSNMSTLIKATKDQEYIKNCIENRRKELNLTTGSVIELIIKTQDSNYMKKCIEKRKEFGLDSFYLTLLILKTQDQNYIKECINKRIELGLMPIYIPDLIKAIKDPVYTKECIAKREEYGLESKYIPKLIETLNDSNYTKECIVKRSELGLTPTYIADLIKTIKDPNYTKECIAKRQELGFYFYPDIIVELISKINEPEYTKECIKQKEELHLTDKQILKLINGIDDIEIARECVKQVEKIGIDDLYLKVLKMSYDEEYLNNLLENGTRAVINLPPEMTIGIEIESIGSNNKILSELADKLFNDWTLKKDGSIKPNASGEQGTEIVSPVLTNSNENASKEIKKVCTILEEFNNYTNSTCGGHIHIGADYLDNVNAWQNLLELWTNTEKILYIVSNEKGSIPREGSIKFAKPISREFEKAFNLGNININTETDLKKLKLKILNFQNGDRYKGINFQNLESGGKQTIEIRLANGTLNAKGWIENINLFGGIVKTAQELSIIQSKEESKLSEEEMKKLIYFENIRSDELNEEEKLEELLKLVMEESERSIYKERYEVNSKLLEKNPEFEEEIRSKISRKALKISKNKIGKKVLTGNEKVMWQDMEITKHYIDQKLEEQNHKYDRGK